MYNNISKLISDYLINVLASTRSKTFNLSYFKTLQLGDMLEYPKVTLEFLGQGSSRNVYIISSKKVLKMAYNEAGIMQNKKEVETYVKFGSSGIITKIYDSDSKGLWIISELVKPFLNEKQFLNAAGILPQDIPKVKLESSEKSYIYTPAGKEFALKIQNFTKQSGLRLGDLINFFNYGTNSDGHVVILDSGFDDEVYNKYYVYETSLVNKPEEAYIKIKQASELGQRIDPELEDIVCEDPTYALKLARIPGSNKKKCEMAVLDDAYILYTYMLEIPEADIDYLADYLILHEERAFNFINKRPKHLEILKNKPAWKHIVDEYEENNKELMVTASIRSKDFNINYFKTLTYPHSYHYAADNLEHIGTGTTRFVFILSSKKALKIAGNIQGIAQNKKEVEIYTKTDNKELFAKVYDAADDGRWVICELVKPEDPYSISFVHNDIFNDEQYQNTINELKLNKKEIRNPSQWGKNTDGKSVILDYGIDDEVEKKFY